MNAGWTALGDAQEAKLTGVGDAAACDDCLARAALLARLAGPLDHVGAALGEAARP